MLQKKILKDTALLNGASLVGQALAMVQSFFVMRLLDPHAYGIWAGLTIVLTYSAYAHLGLEYGLGIRLPYHLGKGDSTRAGQLEDTVYVAWTLLSLVVALGVFTYAMVWTEAGSLQRLGLLLITGIIPLNQQVMYLSRWQYSSPVDFTLPSLLSVAQSLISFALIVPLAYVFDVKGVMVGTLAMWVVMCALWIHRTTFRPRWRLSGEVFRECLVIGFPVLIIILGGVLIQTADRLLILNLLPPANLGYYGVTGIGGAFLYGMLAQAGSAIAPHVSREMGRSEDAAPALKKFLIRPTLVFAYVTVAAIMALLFAVPPMVERLLPHYMPGLFAFYLFIPGFFFLGIILTANNILNVVLIGVGRQRLVVYVQFVAVLVEVVAGYTLIRGGMGIAGAALASTLAYAVYGVSILYLCARYVIPDREERFRFIAAVLVPFLYAAAVSGLIYWAGMSWIPDHPLLRASAQLTACGFACVPPGVMLARNPGIRRDLAPLVEGLRSRFRSMRPAPKS